MLFNSLLPREEDLSKLESFSQTVPLRYQPSLRNILNLGVSFQVFTVSSPGVGSISRIVFPANPFDPSGDSRSLVRIVFDGTQSNVPFIANLVEKTGLKVNILSANTKSVGGIGYGQMILELPSSERERRTVIDFFKDGGLAVSEVTINE